ncbi:DUF1972 domain-containing protein [Pedobacter hartonius]|uniref:Glycosyltransferase involved in cell wall bisynthesis n=1 Tax=Pedobacter hartonius TaxID=425514 RepID=A0A1H3Z2G6_9SPHI|nr:DUF1972 domain-containing protein [Pedobacter hartonius]SEA17847.1 Glycosyltransferase involved in cell wall bisynthesis [Pedobacter hartonius]
MKLNIAILGTRGIPNYYGGFEHISEYVSAGLVRRGHEVTVYNSHNHPYTMSSWNDVEIRHCYDPEYLIGTAGQFVYDLNCLLDARKRKYDVIMLMGYMSSSVWSSLYPRKSAIVTNMDDLEWKKSTYSKPVQAFMKYAEKLAVKHSQYYVADSMVIQTYLKDKYKIESKYIPYGADLFYEREREQFNRSEMLKEDYFLLMARMEPENNIENILEGFSHAKVRSLQHNSYLYFHGHSVGGAHLSLLEAMDSEALIAAHHNPFNKPVLHTDTFFSNADEVRNIVETLRRMEIEKTMVSNNLHKIKNQFNWETIIDQYEEFLLDCYYNYNYGRAIYY